MATTTGITVKTKEEALAQANKIFLTDYDKDETASANAGYPIYRHRELNHYSRICDLGNRLEILTGEYSEKVTNIWIQPELVNGMGTQMTERDYLSPVGGGENETTEMEVREMKPREYTHIKIYLGDSKDNYSQYAIL